LTEEHTNIYMFTTLGCILIDERETYNRIFIRVYTFWVDSQSFNLCGTGEGKNDGGEGGEGDVRFEALKVISRYLPPDSCKDKYLNYGDG